MPPAARLWFSLALLASLTGCGLGASLGDTGIGPAPPRDAVVWDASATRTRPASGVMVPTGFQKLVFDIPRGTEVGGYPFSLLCAPPYERVTWITPPGAKLGLAEVVYETLSAQGYDMVGDPARLFELEEEYQRAEALLAGRVTFIRYDLCNAVNFWTGWPEGVTGQAQVRVDWALYSRVDRRMLAQATTEGQGRLDRASADGEYLVLQSALADAVKALGATPAFRAALTRGGTSAPGGDQAVARTLDTLRAGSRDPAEGLLEIRGAGTLPAWAGAALEGRREGSEASPSAPSLASAPAIGTAGPSTPAPAWVDGPGPTAALTVPAAVAIGGQSLGPDATGRGPVPRPEADPPPVSGGLPWLNLPALPLRPVPLDGRVQHQAVLVAAGASHGSGFFVDPDGLLLTNAHVVGNADRVRVVLQDGVPLVGTVERVHRKRDVALVRVPRGRYPALPLRLDPPPVSEAVLAVGAPLSERMQGTVTRGIVSSHRKDRLTGYPLLQADVTVHPGNSGGPLLDANGNVVGITVSGLSSAEGLNTGLNFFIPIADALARLNLRVEGGGDARPGG